MNGVLALDYDGTIAIDGALDPDVRAAIAEVRAAGVVVVLVTGRILDDLRRVAGDLEFRGYHGHRDRSRARPYPATGHAMVLGPPPPARFVEQLRQRQIETALGACVIEANAHDAHAVLTLVREMELPLVLLFNRGRLMIAPRDRQQGGQPSRGPGGLATVRSQRDRDRRRRERSPAARDVRDWPGRWLGKRRAESRRR